MLHLQATMHFHEEGMREMGLDTDGLLEGCGGRAQMMLATLLSVASQ